MMFRNKSVDVHQFSMIPSSHVPRSRFKKPTSHKTTMDGGYLYPVYLDEVLPGDTFQVKMTAFARLATPIFPIMDNLYLESFFFFVPNRLLWTNWKKFNGEQVNPGDSTSFVVPYSDSPVGGYAIKGLQDIMGLPTVGQVGGGNVVRHNTLHLRAYNLIYNEWFRDENLQNSVIVDTGDGPDTPANYVLLKRGKRKDYFTSCLPWAQKGTAVTMPLGTSAPVIGTGDLVPTWTNTVSSEVNTIQAQGAGAANMRLSVNNASNGTLAWTNTKLIADLSSATAATINSIRQSFQIQTLLERDARGGTRYTEIVRSHFGVVSPDARLQRPEYLGGGSTPIAISPIAQTSGTSATGTTTPLGTLSAMGSVVAGGHGFSQSFTEHGVIVGLVSVRADLNYQQGLNKMWSRSTRYDYYWPAFAMLGEQAVLNKELYCDGSANDANVFGYQERWAEYRIMPSKITGLFRSTSAGTIDPWHLAQKFGSLPSLNASFIVDSTDSVLQRAVAVGSGAGGQQLIFDSTFDVTATRPLPMYSVPQGLGPF